MFQFLKKNGDLLPIGGWPVVVIDGIGEIEHWVTFFGSRMKT
jgi:hypothetical protein